MRCFFSTWRHVKRRWRQHSDRRREFFWIRRLHSEPLEDRHLLAVITVDTLTDEADGSVIDGDISLRDAIAVAMAGDTIDFDAALDGGTILLTLGELVITRSMTIDASLLASGLTIDASGNDPTPAEDNGDGSRIFHMDDGEEFVDSPVTLSGLTLTGGDTQIRGGAILTEEGLMVVDSTVSGNSGGGVHGERYVTIETSTISGNAGDENGGGVFSGADVEIRASTISGNSSGGKGGGIYADGNVTVTFSSVAGNSAARGGGIYADFGVSINSSTISDNSADGAGGGIHARTVTVESSTISGNSADEGGGIYADNFGVSINSSMITGNTAWSSGGGVFARESGSVNSSTISASSINNSRNRSGARY